MFKIERILVNVLESEFVNIVIWMEKIEVRLWKWWYLFKY